MPQTNSGRKGKRRKSKEVKSPKKKPRRSYSNLQSQCTDSSETDNSSILESPPNSFSTPLTIKISKIRNTDLFEISSQEPKIMGDESNTKSPEMSQRDFQKLVLSKLCGLETTIQSVDNRFISLEKKTDEQGEDIVELKTTASEQLIKIQQLEEEMKMMKDNKQANIETKIKNKVIIKNLAKQDWNPEKKHNEANKLIHHLLPNTKDIVRCEEKTTTGILVVTLDSSQKFEDIMKQKKSLKEIEEYSNVYIEEELSREEQRYRASMRAVAKVTKGVIFRGGQIRETKTEPPNKRFKKIPVRQNNTATMKPAAANKEVNIQEPEGENIYHNSQVPGTSKDI